MHKFYFHDKVTVDYQNFRTQYFYNSALFFFLLLFFVIFDVDKLNTKLFCNQIHVARQLNHAETEKNF